MVCSITLQTSKLFTDGNATKIAAAVTYEASTDTATLDPTPNSLQQGLTYKAEVTTRDEDVVGNLLDQNPIKTGFRQEAWSFTVA